MFPRLRCHFRRVFRIRILRNVCGCGRTSAGVGTSVGIRLSVISSYPEELIYETTECVMSAVCVCVVWTRHRRNTQGDSTAPTEP